LLTSSRLLEVTVSADQSLPQGKLLGEGQRRGVAKLAQDALAIAIVVRNPGETSVTNAIVEEMLGQDIDALATVDKLDERLPVLEGRAAIRLEAARRAEICRAEDRVGIAVDVVHRRDDVRSAGGPISERELPMR